MKIYTNDLVKGHSDFKVKCLTFGLYTQVSDSGPLGPLVFMLLEANLQITIYQILDSRSIPWFVAHSNNGSSSPYK